MWLVWLVWRTFTRQVWIHLYRRLNNNPSLRSNFTQFHFVLKFTFTFRRFSTHQTRLSYELASWCAEQRSMCVCVRVLPIINQQTVNTLESTRSRNHIVCRSQGVNIQHSRTLLPYIQFSGKKNCCRCTLTDCLLKSTSENRFSHPPAPDVKFCGYQAVLSHSHLTSPPRFDLAARVFRLNHATFKWISNAAAGNRLDPRN